MRYLIIEHPGRGIYTGFNWETNKPRFSWSILRTSEKALAFYSDKTVLKEMERWRNDRLVQACKLLAIENGRVKQCPQPHLGAKAARAAE